MYFNRKCKITFICHGATIYSEEGRFSDCCQRSGKRQAGNAVTIVGVDGTVYVKGTSSITITVNSYSDKVDLSGADTPADAGSFKF